MMLSRRVTLLTAASEVFTPFVSHREPIRDTKASVGIKAVEVIREALAGSASVEDWNEPFREVVSFWRLYITNPNVQCSCSPSLAPREEADGGASKSLNWRCCQRNWDVHGGYSHHWN